MKETKDERAARQGGENELRGSLDAQRIQQRLRKQDRKTSRKTKR